MFIDVHELELHPLDFREDFRPNAIDLGAELRQLTDLSASGRADLLEERHGTRGAVIKDIRIVGSFSAKLEISCARCLEPVVRDVNRSFDLLYRPQGVDASGAEELSVTQAEAEIGYYSGDGVMLEDVLREQVLLALPIKTVCDDTCRGLCPHCGLNLNTGTCSCKEERSDPRWESLKELRDKLQS